MRSLVGVAGATALTLLAGQAFASAPVGVGQVQVEVRENSVGKEKGTKYVRVHFIATVNEPVSKGMTVLVNGACKSDVRSKEGAISALGARLEEVPQGGTKNIVVPLFITDGFHVKPHTCDLRFSYGRMGTRTGERIASYCWSGGITRPGACP